jgi:hypothetical protein
MTKLTAVAIPILPGKTEQWKKFSNELKTRYKKEFNESRKNAGVQERTFFQSTPQGDFVLVTHEGENPADAMKKIGAQTGEFTKWFISQVKELHGFDLSQPNALPPNPEMVIESEPIAETVIR